jgi:hypothetical protein
MNRIFRLVLLGLVAAWGVGMWVHEKEAWFCNAQETASK